MPTVLVTAFEPYDRWQQNASWLSLLELTRELPEQPRIVTRLYPVDFQKVRQRLEVDLADGYDFALHLGQAPGSGRIQLEAIGLNVGGTSTQLADHFQPLDSSGPLAYRSELPLADWAGKNGAAGIPATVSYHAGTFLCNAVLYLSHHLARARGLATQATFVHMPLAPQQVLDDRGDTATMSPGMTSQALRIILQEIAEANDK